MASNLRFSDSKKALWSNGERFDEWSLSWHAAEEPSDLAPVEPVEAVRFLYTASTARRIPVGVIGPRQATAQQYETARALGRAIADVGLPLLCGGKSGVMEAVCRGNAEGGGQSIALLPDADWTTVNAYAAMPLATGVGEARNALIACACSALIAVGGGYGTLSEIALGLRFGKRVVALPSTPDTAGTVVCRSVEEAMTLVCADRLGGASM